MLVYVKTKLSLNADDLDQIYLFKSFRTASISTTETSGEETWIPLTICIFSILERCSVSYFLQKNFPLFLCGMIWICYNVTVIVTPISYGHKATLCTHRCI